MQNNLYKTFSNPTIPVSYYGYAHYTGPIQPFFKQRFHSYLSRNRSQKRQFSYIFVRFRLTCECERCLKIVYFYVWQTKPMSTILPIVQRIFERLWYWRSKCAILSSPSGLNNVKEKILL